MRPLAGGGHRDGWSVNRCLVLFLVAQVVIVLWAVRQFTGSQLAYTPGSAWRWGGSGSGVGSEKNTYRSRGGSSMCAYEASLSEENEDLGHGTFGTVFRHNMTTRIRLFQQHDFAHTGQQEAATMAGMHHAHIVRLLGVVTNDSKPIGFMTEYWSEDTLEDVIDRERFFPGDHIPLESRVSIALQLASAVEHIHGKQVALINLSPSGISAMKGPTDKLVVKIANMRVAKALNRPHDPYLLGSLKKLLSSSPYAAPEILHEPKTVSARSDIYSLGAVLWELVTRTALTKYGDLLESQNNDLEGRSEMGIPNWCHEDYRSLVVDCLATEPMDRPSAGDVVERLQGLMALVVTGQATESHAETEGWTWGRGLLHRDGDAVKAPLRVMFGGVRSGSVGEKTGIWQGGDFHGRSVNGRQGSVPGQGQGDGIWPHRGLSSSHRRKRISAEAKALEMARSVVSCACGMDFDGPSFDGKFAIQTCHDRSHGEIVSAPLDSPAGGLKMAFQVPLEEMYVEPAVVQEAGVATRTATYTVAVKRFKKTLRSGNELEIFLHSQLRHRNVVQFMGVIVDYDDEKGWIPSGFMMESVNMGSLDNLLDVSRAVFPSEPVPLRLRLEIALQFAQGLAYLHEQQIVHFDVKPLNVLLKRENGKILAKVIDLGYSKKMEGGTVDARKSSSTGYRGTRKYLAPEIVLHAESVDEKVDVYSFGVSMWKMYMRTSPHEGYSKDAISDRIKAGDPIPLPDLDACEPMWSDLIKACTLWEPERRPSMAEVAERLKQWVHELSNSTSTDQYAILD
eukprot:evm.model.scf_2518.2 EVM.evm.TU.scf_2518.2   scf_2518:7489-13698(-)